MIKSYVFPVPFSIHAHALCMDVKAERKKMAKLITNALKEILP